LSYAAKSGSQKERNKNNKGSSKTNPHHHGRRIGPRPQGHPVVPPRRAVLLRRPRPRRLLLLPRHPLQPRPAHRHVGQGRRGHLGRRRPLHHRRPATTLLPRRLLPHLAHRHNPRHLLHRRFHLRCRREPQWRHLVQWVPRHAV